MLWLDSSDPPGKTGPGVQRGPCDPSTGVPSETREKYPDSSVVYSNIKVGTLGSTFGPSPAPSPPSPPSPPPSPPSPPPPPSPPSPTTGQCCWGAAGVKCTDETKNCQ